MVPVAILCGGKGTRMRESGETMPKPLVEIGGKPILWHVMSLYASQGLSDFVLLLGYGADRIREFTQTCPWNVTYVDTGEDTPTGGRLARATDHFTGGTSCLTYGDGVADIDLDALLAFHARRGALATMTVVRPYSQWGIALIDSTDRVEGFREKPRLDYWINGGFFCLEPGFLELVGPESVLEREPLERAAAAGELAAYRHEGFWDCMDTYKDAVVLNDLWAGGDAPWNVWSRAAEGA